MVIMHVRKYIYIYYRKILEFLLTKKKKEKNLKKFQIN